jgi:hypothetical protein
MEGTVYGTLANSTAETFETDWDPMLERTVWYTWTAPEDGMYYFNINNAFMVVVYDGMPPLGATGSGANLAGATGRSTAFDLRNVAPRKVAAKMPADPDTNAMINAIWRAEAATDLVCVVFMGGLA